MTRLRPDERPDVVQKDLRVLDPDEIEKLLAAATPTYRPLLTTAVFCGLRLNELLGLKWADVDLDKGRLHVKQQYDRGPLQRPEDEEVGAHRRAVPRGLEGAAGAPASVTVLAG